jgi:lantibiotic biosynthesis protein
VKQPSRDPAPRWGESLYTGACGIALLHIEYARTGVGDWNTVHQWAATMTRSPVTAHPGACGLDRGAPAVAFTLNAAGQPAYTSALATLDGHITDLTGLRLQRAHERINAGQFPALREFDLIHGLTGIGVYLLHRHRGGEALRDVLSYLARLTKPLRTGDGEAAPGWWSRNAPSDRPSPQWPGGHGNLGLAHGIAGPLALLSIAMRRGVTVDGQADAISRIGAWLAQWRISTGPQAWWPGVISAPEWRAGAVRQAGQGRPSWCYGTPGLARAQQLAALALADPSWRRVAEHALAGCVTDEQQLARLDDASLCHGWAGLVQATWRAATDADDPEPFAVPQLLRRMERHLSRHRPPAHDGLLDGMAGVQLARHTIAADVSPRSGWDACLLLGDGPARTVRTQPTSADLPAAPLPGPPDIHGGKS